MRQIYLDYNATTPIAPEVCDAMDPFLREHFGNPSSSHSLGRLCKEAIEVARAQVAALIGAQPDEIFFTAGGTESNNLVIKGTFFAEANRTARFVTSAFEHPAIKKPALFHQQSGGQVVWIGTDSHGVVDLDQLESVCQQDDVRLVSVMHANNEIGTLQPISKISRICAGRKIPLHTDAAQSIGKVRVRVDELGVDYLTIAGHKLYAPKGVGALFVRAGQNLVPSVHGANHEKGVRPGTENVPYIVGLGVAAKLALTREAESIQKMKQVRDRFEQILIGGIAGLTINGHQAERLPNTSSLNFPKVTASEMLKKVPELCVSTGAACHSDTIALSDTLSAIGLNEQVGAGTVRVSCGKNTTMEEMELAASLLINAWENSVENAK